MELRRLGRTEVKVSAICLGTMTFGQQNTQAEGFEQMDFALARGVNFFDVAEMYPVPPRAETYGGTETIIGNWFASRRNRDKVILATKVCGASSENRWARDAGTPTRPDRAQIFEACEKSLKRLQTDYIDLYQVHWPDRPMRSFGVPQAEPHPGEVPIEETLEALGALVTQGKVRFLGISNESPWGVMRYLNAAAAGRGPRIVSIQNAYSLIARSFEIGLSEFAMREQVGLLAYSPLAQGYLSGKYQGGALPKGSRKALFNRLQRYENPGTDDVIARYVDLARRHGLDPAQMALKFCYTRPFITSTIIGATSMAQLKADIDAFALALPREVMEGISAIHRERPNPAI